MLEEIFVINAFFLGYHCRLCVLDTSGLFIANPRRHSRKLPTDYEWETIGTVDEEGELPYHYTPKPKKLNRIYLRRTSERDTLEISKRN